MYALNLVYHHFAHHSSHSGYDRLTAYVQAENTNGESAPWFGSMLPDRVIRSIVWRAKIGAYTKERFLAEMKIAGKLWNGKSEVFHFLYGEDAYCYSGFLPRRKGKKITATFHQPPEYFERVINRRNHLNKLDGLVAVSKNQYEYFCGLVDKSKVVFVPHGIDTDFFKPNENEEKKRTRRCLFVGNWLRDFRTLCEVVETVGKADSSIKFTIVTTKKGFDKVQHLKGVEILCGVGENELLKLYRDSLLLVLPLENCTANNSILEAMACGLPIVTTDISGVRDYVDSSCASLTAAGDAGNMAEQVLSLVNDDSRLEMMSRSGRERAMEFSWPVVAGKLQDFYSGLYR